MSRQAVNIVAEQAAGRPYGRRAVWQAMRERVRFTVVELRIDLPHVPESLIREYLKALKKAGYVEPGPLVSGQSRANAKVRQFNLVKDTGLDAPRLRKDGSELPPTGQQRMWLAMKCLPEFTPADLAEISDAAARTNVTAAAKYLEQLHAAGYLARTPSGAYRLINNTGGLAPMIQSSKVVFDPNLNRVVAWAEDIEP